MTSPLIGTGICAICKKSQPGRGYTTFQKDVIDTEYLGSPLPGQTRYKLTWRTTPLTIFICDGCLRRYTSELILFKSIPPILFVVSFVGFFTTSPGLIHGLSGIGILVFGIWGIGNLRTILKSSYGVLLAARTARRNKGTKGTSVFCESDSQYDHTEAPY